MSAVAFTREDVAAERQRRREGESVAEQAEKLSLDMRLFCRHAWPHVVPQTLVPSWHIDAIDPGCRRCTTARSAGS